MLLLSIVFVIFICSIRAEDDTKLTRNVEAESVFLRLKGDLDPKLDDVFFIFILQSTFDDYCRDHISHLLYGMDIAANFYYDLTVSELNVTSKSVVITSWCEIKAAFSISTEIDSTMFTNDIATNFVIDFFTNSTKLLNRLEMKNNITINTLEVFDQDSDIVKSTIKKSSTANDSNSNSGPNQSNTMKILGIISGVIIGVAIATLIISTLYQKYNIEAYEDERLGIKRQDSSRTNVTNNNVKHVVSILDKTNSDHDDNSDENHAESDDPTSSVDDRNQTSLKDPPIESPGSFITDSFDEGNDESVTVHQFSPTSQYNSTTTSSSPIWSTFSATTTNTGSSAISTSPYSTEETVAKRYRWQDDNDVTNRLSIPLSSGSSTYSNTNHTILETESVSNKSVEE